MQLFLQSTVFKIRGAWNKKKILGKRGGEEANNHWSSLSRTSKRTSFRKNVLNKISRKNKLNRSSVGGGDAGGSNAHPKVLIYKKSGQYPYNLSEIPENPNKSLTIWGKSLKIWTKIAPDLVWLQ